MTKRVTKQGGDIHYINSDTGEFLGKGRESSRSVYRAEKEMYSPIFCNDGWRLYALPNLETNVILYMIINLNVNSNEVAIIGDYRADMVRVLGITRKQTLNNILVELAKKNMIRHKERGVYVVNPFIAWKGDFNNRIEFLNRELALGVIYEFKDSINEVNEPIGEYA